MSWVKLSHTSPLAEVASRRVPPGLSDRYGPHRFQFSSRRASSWRRIDSAVGMARIDTSRAVVLVAVKRAHDTPTCGAGATIRDPAHDGCLLAPVLYRARFRPALTTSNKSCLAS